MCFGEKGLKPTFVAQQTTPVPLTAALPRVDACPVDTAGIGHALVAELALPAVVTAAEHKGGAVTTWLP